MAVHPFLIDVAPYRLSGTVVGALLNDPAELAALGDAVNRPPHQAPPKAPVLAVRPRHTLAGDGDRIEVPAGGVTVGVSLAAVIGRSACRVGVATALDHVSGYLVAGDLSLPRAGHYRPAARFKARDGFCPLGRHAVPAAGIADPDDLAVHVAIDGEIVQAAATAGRTRGLARLIADVSEFMTLHEGDLLLLGASHGAPLAHAGQRIELAIDGIGRLGFGLVAEEAA